MMSGTTLFWRNQGWGYLSPGNQEMDDIYVHRTGLIGVKQLTEGQRVEFEIGERQGKPIAISVKVLADATSENECQL